MVADSRVLKTTRPEFPEAALAAAKPRRFVPTVRNGRAGEANADLPFAFEAPAEASKQVN